MEPRDLVGSARPKEADLRGSRAGLNEEHQLAAGGPRLVHGDDVINGAASEGEGLEEQGEGLMEEQEFSIKEASFQEGSLKLKIQTTKRTKKPPKNLENYICPPEIRMTIRPPAGEGKGGRQGRTGGGAGAGRGPKDEERGPPRKRVSPPFLLKQQDSFVLCHLQTYERQFRMPEQRDGGLLQLLGDPAPPKHQPRGSLLSNTQQTQQHQIGPGWITSAAPFSSPGHPADIELAGDMGGGSRGSSLDPTQPYSRTATPSPSPQRSMTPDLQLPVVTDASILNLTSLSRGKGLQEVSEQLFGNIKRKYGRKDSQRMFANPHSADAPWGRQSERDPESLANSEERQRYRQEGTAEQFQDEREERRKEEREQANAGRRGDEEERGMAMQVEDGKGRKRRRRPSFDESFSMEERSQQQVLDAAENPTSSPKSRINISPSPSPRPRMDLSPSPSTGSNPGAGPRPTKATERWSYLKAKSHTSLTSPQRDSMGSPSALTDPPSAFPITPSSPLYTNTDSLTVHAPIKRKRGRPKKQPLLTVETIHEGTSTSPLSPLAKESNLGLNRRRKMHTLNPLVHAASASSDGSNNMKVKRGRGHPRAANKTKLGKMQSILNEILSGSSQNGSLVLKSASAPVTSAMSAMATTIEARLGKQINVSKRGTIYIGKKRGRKPRAETQGSVSLKTGRDKPQMSLSTSGLYDSPAVPSTNSSPSSSAPSLRAGSADATMPSLQPISALLTKPSGRGFLSGGWKLSPPRLLANSPSHLSEGASVKEVTLSPISESHSEETIPSDSGIGTDNNSTSDQTEKGPASRRRYSFDLCGFESPEAAALDTSNRGSRPRCERKVTAVDSYLSQQEKKQKHHRRKRKCLQTRDHLHFLSELEEVVLKFQQLRVSHRLYTCYPQHPYPSIFRLNFHHYYPLSYDSYACDSSSYLRRSADLKAKRRRGRPAKASEPIASKLPFVPGYGYSLGGGNYYAAPYAMPYAPPLNLGYFPPTPPFYLPHHSLGPAPPSPFMRPALPPPKAFHTSGHPKLQMGAKIRSASGPLQGPTVRAEALGSLGSGSAGGLAGVRLHKRKHKHKHKHKDEPLLSPRDRQELGGLFSGAKTNVRLGMLSERRDLAGQGSSKHLEKQRGNARGSNLGSGMGIFESDQLSARGLADSQFHSCQTSQPVKGFMSSYSSQSQRSESASDLFKGLREEECVPAKRRYKRREVEQIQKDVRRMHSLNFDHVQKILRAKRLQRQAKTGNNVIKRRPGRPRKQPLADDGRTLGMPVLERCDNLPGRHSLRPSLTLEPRELPGHDSILATIETVVHQARSVPPPANKEMPPPPPLPSPSESDPSMFMILHIDACVLSHQNPDAACVHSHLSVSGLSSCFLTRVILKEPEGQDSLYLTHIIYRPRNRRAAEAEVKCASVRRY
uniref:SET binding protein 1 n=1 Tax=Fundulus heteroclitus TaxID=8078 RepID=A0A3Q2QCH0_FUNHE